MQIAQIDKGAQPLTTAETMRPVVPRDRLLRMPDVLNLTGCKKSTVYKFIGEGTFPKPLRLSARMVVWPETAVLGWVQDRIAEAAKTTA